MPAPPTDRRPHEVHPSRTAAEPDASSGPREAHPLQRAGRILLCLRWGIGDLVMQLPLLDALRQFAPQAELTAVGARPAVELLEGDGRVDRVWEAQALGFEHWGDLGSDAARRAFTARCRVERFDCVLERLHAPQGIQRALQQVDRPSFDTAVAPAAQNEPGWRLLRRAAEQGWGIPVAPAPARIEPTPVERAAAQRIIGRLRADGPLIGVAPIASGRLKRGDPVEFARAADALMGEFGARLLLFGGRDPDTCAVAKRVRRPERVLRLDTLHLRFTAAMLARCRLLLCNDTGLMHLAAAVGTPVVAVFAATAPELYLPPGGVAVPRWEERCRYREAKPGRFGMPPCVAAGACLDPGHRRVERWADAAVARASAVLAGSAIGSGASR